MEQKMKLYVWTGFDPDYSDGLAFAIAETEEKARELVIESRGYNPSVWGDLTEHSLSEPIAFSVCGGG